MAITPNALMRQLQNRQSIGTSMGEFIKLPFNSMVNATAKVFRIPIKTPLKYAVQAYQAERYIPKYNVPVEHQDSPQTVIAWCVNNGHIGADPYPFPKVKDATTWQTGKYFEFSDVQLKYINKDYEVLSMEYLEGSIRAGKSVANLTRAANFFASGDHGLNFGAGAYSFTAAKRLMLDSEMGFGHTIFAGKTVSGQESMRITYPTLLYPYTQASINVLSLQNQSSAKKILGQSVDMVLLEELSALDSSTLWELRNRLVQSKHALIMVSSNPMMFRQDVYEYIMSWNGNNPNTEESNHKFHFERWTMDVNPLFQGVEGKKKWEEIAALYRHDDALMQEKIYGRRSIPKGLVLAQFDESRNVIDHLPDMNYVRMAAGLDIGYNDATSLNIIIYGHRTSDAKPIAIQVANFYHRVGKVCNLANFSTKDQSPQDICQAVINSWVIVRRALQRRYGSLVHTGEIYVDPSNLGERNLLRQMLDNYRIPETYGLEIWKADNNSKKNSHTVEKGKTGAEYGFSMLNRSLANQNFYFLADGVLDTGGQLGNRHTLDEVKTYSRNPKDGSLIMSGNGHLDAIHSLRYIHNMLVKELYPYEN